MRKQRDAVFGSERKTPFSFFHELFDKKKNELKKNLGNSTPRGVAIEFGASLIDHLKSSLEDRATLQEFGEKKAIAFIYRYVTRLCDHVSTFSSKKENPMQLEDTIYAKYIPEPDSPAMPEEPKQSWVNLKNIFSDSMKRQQDNEMILEQVNGRMIVRSFQSPSLL